MRIQEAARGYLKISAFQRVVCVVILSAFGTNSVVWAGPQPELKAEEMLQQIVTRFDQARSVEEFVKGQDGFITRRDISYLKKNLGSFPKMKQNVGVGLRGGNLIIISRGTEKMTVAIDSLKDSTFTINGKRWQANPYDSVEANMQSLQKTLMAEHHSSLENFWGLLVPDAQALEPISTLILIVLALIVLGGFAWAALAGRNSKGYLSMSCEAITDQAGTATHKINVQWKDKESGKIANLVIDPSNPEAPSLTKSSRTEASTCTMDAAWNAGSDCNDIPSMVKGELPHLKRALAVCKDPERLKKLNDKFPAETVTTGKAKQIIDDALAPK